MDRIRIRGGRPLTGEIAISGAKNAALPLMAACLLTDGTLRLSNLPHLVDIATLANLLVQLGVEIRMNGAPRGGPEGGHEGGPEGGPGGRVLELTAREVTHTEAPYELVRKMRASVLVLGPLLARAGHAEVSLPGGCAIGTRPIDAHLRGLEALGAEIELRDGYIHARVPGSGRLPGRLKGAEIVFQAVSVGATENLLMAATLAEGETRLVNAAREPEITDLAECLLRMGAAIEGIGGDTLVIQGVERLGGAEHRIIPDRIETGTYAMAAAITGGELDLIGARPAHLRAVIEALGAAGVAITESDRGLHVERANGPLRGVDVMTEPFPGFPTDLQAQMMALMSTSEGASMITETIFENRFMHVPELTRMGADINVNGASAMVRGRPGLTGAEVMATDLRASVSLVLAALAADGETLLNRVYHLDRGYERVEEKLAACGAEIERIK
ncbi:MAG: UDP-N-acetylglucosamine 1-carboxyvinyltransferase [Proteobacteria bacterium]|nr:UDP-N-acetylglucosamine 1-carboxyvinyltransferase [Pseudomonadota bacterium]